MKSMKLWLTAIGMLVAVNLAWIWRMDQNSREYNQRISSNNNRLIQLNKELSLMNRSWETALLTDNKNLPDSMTGRNMEGFEQQLRSMIGSSKKLVLVLSDRNCSTCIDQLLFSVKDRFNPSMRNRLLILYQSDREAAGQWKTRMQILQGAQFLQIRENALGLPADSLDIPYFFVAGPDFQARLTYAPFPSLEKQTSQYLETIKNRFINPIQ